MFLSDATILEEINEKHLIIEPYSEKMIQPAGIDIRLGRDFMTWVAGAGNPIVDPAGMSADASINYDRVICNKTRPFFYLYPNQFVIGSSYESIKIPNDIISYIDGRSSLARIGLLINASSRRIEPGFEGKVSVELLNVTNRPIKLTPGMKIAHLSFARLDRPSAHPYGSSERNNNYQRQNGAKSPVFAMLEEVAGQNEQ